MNHHRSPRPSSIPAYIWITIGSTCALVGYQYYSCLEEAPLTKRKRLIATSPVSDVHRDDACFIIIL